ncbi:MAG: tetratricopeptide repeat protein [Polyangiaceae bacterium]
MTQERLKREFEAAFDEQLSSFDMGAQRERVLSRVRPPRRVPGARALALLAAAAIFVVAALFFVRRSNNQPSPVALSFQIGGAQGVVGEWLAAPSDKPLPVAFSDGSRLTLAAGSQARVAETTTSGAEVVLERGSLEAEVRHRADTSWRVDAGPFQVHVVGTRFEVSWDPTMKRLRLTLREGAVDLTGPGIDGARRVAAGESVELALGEPPPSATASNASAALPAPSASSAARPSTEDPKDDSAIPAFRRYANSGDNKSAWAALSEDGFGAWVARSGPADLALLADIARFTGHPAEAAQALVALRDRFPRSSQAADAAFMLGRAAFDQKGAVTEALSWFTTYLTERPNGTYAQEALGRVLECHARAGSTEAARKAATRYLELYPNGPHAEIARRTLGTSEPSPYDEP